MHPLRGHNYAEMFSFDVGWKQIQSYPSEYNQHIYCASIVYIKPKKSFYVVGGFDGDQQIDIIAAYSTQWSRVGTLKSARDGHGTIWTGDALIVVGGVGKPQSGITETCLMNSDGNFECETRQPQLFDDFLYPELFLVNIDYCQ